MELNVLKRHVSSLNILIWSVVQCSHAACKNFAGLFACRLLLGICEGSITAGFMIVSSMFYTRREHTARVGYWCKDYRQPSFNPFLTPNRFDDWDWSECQVSLPSQTLTYALAQIISGFISFGTLHIQTTGFEPWQWYDQDQHLTMY